MDKLIDSSEDRVFVTTRLLAIAVVPFLVVAFVILYLFPDRSGQLFAWPIKPPINAMLLAAAYAGGVYFFGTAALAKRWHTVKAGFLPVATFASLLGIVTLLHWGKFTHGSLAFFFWAALYFTTPFLVLGAWLHNRTQDPGPTASGEALVPVAWRVFFGLLALVTLPLALLLFVSPSLIIPLWSWKLTPLTARVMSAMFALPAVLSLEITLDPRWTFARRLLEAQFLSLVLFVIAILRDQADIDTTNLTYPLFLVLIVGVLLALLLFFVQMRRRVRSTTPGG